MVPTIGAVAVSRPMKRTKRKIAQSTHVEVKVIFGGKSYFCSVPIFNFLLFRFSAPYGEGCTHCRGRKERFLDFPIHSNT